MFNLLIQKNMNVWFKLAIAVGGWCAVVGTVSAESGSVHGTVRDSMQTPIAGATVTVRSGAFSATTRTVFDGTFSVSDVPNGRGAVTVVATGFAEVQRSWIELPASAIEIVLGPATMNEEVVVSATRSAIRLSETPGSTVLVTKEDANASPDLAVDDMLRQVPGFTLFRRSGSRTANPTSQGVSLRGLGASGPSRALVLEDGIPMLDPFGGWVYWERMPPVELASVEVFRGGASSLYGSDALGGVVQFMTRQPAGPSLSLLTSYGNEETPDFALWAGDRIGKWDFSLAADLYRSAGYILVPSSQRGSVDTAANSEHANLDLNIGHQLGADGKIFVRGNFYDEFRHNGSPLQTNDTQIGEGSAGIDKQLTSRDSLSFRMFGDVQGYDQVFSSIASNRDSESLVDLQSVPSQQLGTAGQWTHFLGTNQTLIAGGDIQEVIGASDEQLFSSGKHTANNAAGGRQRTAGLFGEDIFHGKKWTIILGAQFDDWSNLDGSSIRTPVSSPGPTSATYFPDRNDTAFSPKLSALRALNQNFSLTASVYRAFRAPTLNELYRSFRLGNVLTESNAALQAEHLTGAEAGVNLAAMDRKLDLRGTFFWSDIVDPVENVTLSTTAALITRERENLGRTRSRGVELDSVLHLHQYFEISAGFEYIDATVVSFPAGMSLQGLDIPEVPRHEFTWQARYWNPKIMLLSVEGRFVGKQFDDDQNQFPLNSFYVMDLLAARSINKHLETFAAIENLLDESYMVARTPITNLGPPVLFRAGIRLNFPQEGK